jgi:hypothetical protein
VLLAPQQTVDHHVPCSGHVKIASAQKSQQVSVIRKFAFVRRLKPIFEFTETTLLQLSKLTKKAVNVLGFETGVA